MSLQLIGLTVLTIITGWASQYDPGVMDNVITYRQNINQLPENLIQFDGFVATPDCIHIGDTVLLRPTGEDVWELFLVTDCAGAASSYNWMVSNNILVEVDYKTAERWSTIGRGIKIELLWIHVYTQAYDLGVHWRNIDAVKNNVEADLRRFGGIPIK